MSPLPVTSEATCLRRYSVPAALARIGIRHLWTLQGEASEIHETLLWPLPSCDWVINLGDPLVYQTPDGAERIAAPCHLNTLRFRSLRVRQHGRVDVIGVTIPPYLRLVSGESDSTTCKSIGDREIRSLLTQLADRSNTPDRLSILHRFLSRRASEVTDGDWSPVMLHWLFTTTATSRDVLSASRQTGLSRRQLERVFKGQADIAPREWIALNRFHRLLQGILAGSQPLASLAEACGYADQAHATRAFKACTGITPAALRRQHVRPVQKPQQPYR